ncbi:enolase C-terminal domain-like protein [Neobacillus vireti]|uniref:enolase C-terminal domain-like protein n=1 Tax=Neobacillus vireti TaxID=220686 RepID=UPI003B5895F6
MYFIRIHVSQIGGITPARKITAACEMFGIRTTWHGPADVSPVGHAANVHLNVSSPNLEFKNITGLVSILEKFFLDVRKSKMGSCTRINDQGLVLIIMKKKLKNTLVTINYLNGL